MADDVNDSKHWNIAEPGSVYTVCIEINGKNGDNPFVSRFNESYVECVQLTLRWEC